MKVEIIMGGQMKSKDRRQYTNEFKTGAVKLVLEQGYMATEAARNLGINVSNLRRWIEGCRQHKEQAFPGNGRMMPEQEELRRLREENRRLKLEREILKKTAAFFASESR
jgi:transposase